MFDMLRNRLVYMYDKKPESKDLKRALLPETLTFTTSTQTELSLLLPDCTAALGVCTVITEVCRVGPPASESAVVSDHTDLNRLLCLPIPVTLSTAGTGGTGGTVSVALFMNGVVGTLLVVVLLHLDRLLS